MLFVCIALYICLQKFVKIVKKKKKKKKKQQQKIFISSATAILVQAFIILTPLKPHFYTVKLGFIWV